MRSFGVPYPREVPYAIELGRDVEILPGEIKTFPALIERPFRPERLSLALVGHPERWLWAWFRVVHRREINDGSPATALTDDGESVFTETLLTGYQIELALRNEGPSPVIVSPRLIGVVED